MSYIAIKGIYRDRLLDPQGTAVFDSEWRNNMIVLRCRVLLSSFLKNDGALGLRALQVGRGDPSWDTNPPPLPDPNTINALVDASPAEIPVAQLKLEYLDNTDSVVVNATSRLQITATLGPGVPASPPNTPFPLREFALFGQLNGVRHMIDYIRHPLIQKDASMTLERKVRLIF
ncbi:MAG TPA: hypothetical protein VE133_06770 [Candidatus Sulfotelmatobacter sp.]|nr:hypothetical protein [Candidatus Sulfotelmatobacter sp.]